MPYNPGVNDISGELLAQGITSAANKLSQSFNDRTQAMEESRAADVSLEKLLANGYISNDEFLKSMGGSLSQKKAAVGGAVTNQAMKIKDRSMAVDEGNLSVRQQGMMMNYGARASSSSARPAPTGGQFVDPSFFDQGAVEFNGGNIEPALPESAPAIPTAMTPPLQSSGMGNDVILRPTLNQPTLAAFNQYR